MADEHKQLKDSIDRLIKVQTVLANNQKYWRILLNGVLAGVGGALGAAVVIALLSAFLSHAEVIPIVGRWLSELTPYVQSATRR